MYISRSSRMVIIPLQLRCCFFIEYILECWGPAMRNRVIRVYIFFTLILLQGFVVRKFKKTASNALSFVCIGLQNEDQVANVSLLWMLWM
jgi:hypothetical protein